MNPLEFEIVNGQNTAEIFVVIMGFVVGFQSHGNHAGLPVVEVENIRFKAHGFAQSFQNRPLEKAETLNIESIVQINPIMAKVVLIVDQVDRHAHDVHLKKTRIHGSPAHVNHRPAPEVQLIHVLILDLLIKRDDHTAVMPQRPQSLGQCADDVTQAA